jgi:hypothetical protein
MRATENNNLQPAIDRKAYSFFIKKFCIDFRGDFLPDFSGDAFSSFGRFLAGDKASSFT